MDKRKGPIDIRNYQNVRTRPRVEKAAESKTKQSKKKLRAGQIDYTFLTILIVIVCAGLIMLLSTSAPAANKKFGNSYHFFIRQLMFGGVGFVAMIIISRIDYRKYKKHTGAFMLLCVVLLVMVFIPKIGVEHNGSKRWINLIVTEFQPSELMKLAIAMFFAAQIELKKYDLKTFNGLCFYFFWIGVTAVLLLLETHLSGTIIICGVAVVIMIVGGMSMKIVAGGAAVVGPLGLLLVLTDPVRKARLLSFLNPFADVKNTGYQVVQGLYAIGSGGLFGLGLGQSVQKYTYLPEPYNDFIFAIICEELGFFGALLVIGLFAMLIIRGVRIALNAPDVFGMLTVVGIMAQVGIQTIFNIAVVTSSIPNTGVTLPFFSYGGTALMVLLAEMGIVLNISRYSERKLN